MFPIGDQDLVKDRIPWVTYTLIAINVLVFLFLEVPIMGDQSAFQNFIQTWGAVPAELQQGEGLHTIFTSMFLHGGWMHLIGNMLFLWVFGDNVEIVMGHIPFVIFYFIAGIAAVLAHGLLNLGSEVPTVGASGAISGVLGAYLVMFPGNKVKLLLLGRRATRATYVSALFFLGLWGLMQLLNGIGATVSTAETTGVAFWAHIGGFVIGLLGGFLFRGPASKMEVEPIQR
ncbi:MAG: rhomboid family intramembrane serine protease [Chloroflexota bacterium]|nr:rhomboid family intramembrane serine protease [Chloroflexota bacterium]